MYGIDKIGADAKHSLLRMRHHAIQGKQNNLISKLRVSIKARHRPTQPTLTGRSHQPQTIPVWSAIRYRAPERFEPGLSHHSESNHLHTNAASQCLCQSTNGTGKANNILNFDSQTEK